MEILLIYIRKLSYGKSKLSNNPKKGMIVICGWMLWAPREPTINGNVIHGYIQTLVREPVIIHMFSEEQILLLKHFDLTLIFRTFKFRFNPESECNTVFEFTPPLS